GFVFAIGGTRLMASLMPSEIPRGETIRLDGPVLLLATMVALLATIGFGVFSALRGTSRSAAPIAAPTARSTRRVGSGALVVAEIALGVVLTVLAGLMVRSFANL